jgi:metallo-beta-lactamase class B
MSDKGGGPAGRRRLGLATVFFALAFSAWSQPFDVDFIRVADGVWLHRSYAMVGGYKTPSNGLLLETNKSLVLIDTAWNEEETERILDFARASIKRPIAACFITHSHQDRAGGIRAINKASIPVYMTSMTYALLTKGAFAFAYRPVLNGSVAIDGLALTIDYFGPTHAPDNIAIWDGRDALLFAGCMIKSLDARDVGNVADADLANWPVALSKLKDKYPGVRIAVPGHGDPGDARLIGHTLDLLGRR